MNTELPPLELEELGQYLQTLPIGLLVADQQDRILWANQTLAGYLGLPGSTLSGLSLSRLPLEPSGHPSGQGRLMRVTALPGEGAAWLSWIELPRPAAMESHHRVIGLVDATELEGARLTVDRLNQALRGQGSTDRSTGLLNQRAVRHQLDVQISRSRRYHNPLSVVLLGPGGSDDGPPDLPEGHMLALARLLRDQTRWPDIVGRWSDSEFLLVLPETSAESANRLVQKVMAGVAGLSAESGAREEGLLAGVAEWRKGDDIHDLMARTASARQQGNATHQPVSTTS